MIFNDKEENKENDCKHDNNKNLRDEVIEALGKCEIELITSVLALKKMNISSDAIRSAFTNAKGLHASSMAFLVTAIHCVKVKDKRSKEMLETTRNNFFERIDAFKEMINKILEKKNEM